MTDDGEKYQINVGFHYLKAIGELMVTFVYTSEWDTVTRINILRQLSLFARIGAKKGFKNELFAAFADINKLLDDANRTGKPTEIEEGKKRAQPLINELLCTILEEFNRRDLLLPKKTTMTTGIFKGDNELDNVEGVSE